jgi:hypothetical protein
VAWLLPPHNRGYPSYLCSCQRCDQFHPLSLLTAPVLAALVAYFISAHHHGAEIKFVALSPRIRGTLSPEAAAG